MAKIKIAMIQHSPLISTEISSHSGLMTGMTTRINDAAKNRINAAGIHASALMGRPV